MYKAKEQGRNNYRFQTVALNWLTAFPDRKPIVLFVDVLIY